MLRFLLKKTFYANFCAGETRREVQRTVTDLKKTGFTGVILAYAKEIVLRKDQSFSECKNINYEEIKAEVQAWRDGNIKTISLTESGDFMGLK